MAAPRFSSALSTAEDSSVAEREAVAALRAGLDGAAPDLVCLFVTHHHGAALDGLGARVRAAMGARTLLGCTAEAAIGPVHEAEREPGLALWAGCLPATEVRPFRVQVTAEEGEDPELEGGPTIFEPSRAACLVLAEPFSFPTEPFLEHFGRDWPGVPAIGGMASGGQGPGQNLLFLGSDELGDEIHGDGAVGVALEGDVEVVPVVSQGCRPVGQPWVVTEVTENRIQRLGGRPALEILAETLRDVTSEDRQLLQSAPFLGLAVDARKEKLTRGDFLARAVMGVAQGERSVVISDHPRRGQTVQFLVRDATSAGDDLRELLAAQRTGDPYGSGDPSRLGALLFTCNGRGSRMFGRPDHDLDCLRETLHPELPAAGFFAMGEIGPIDRQNFLHGFTASIALFRSRE